MLAEGRPVLLAPQQAPADVGASVVIGWDESGEAANAITAAMPFLVSAEKVTIVCVDDIDNVADLQYVMKNGRLYDADTLAEVWPRQRPLPVQLWQGLGPVGVRAGIR